jgi:hypothetical protein
MIFGAATWVAVGAAAFFLFQTEQQIARLKSTLHAFDVRAREATTALADLRVAQQAYVAEGQGVEFWMPKFASLHESLTGTLAALRQSPVSAEASTALDEAIATVAKFGDIDRQTRDYITGDQKLMAADIIFSEGGGERRAPDRNGAPGRAPGSRRRRSGASPEGSARGRCRRRVRIARRPAANAASTGRGRGNHHDRLVHRAYARSRERSHDRGARQGAQAGRGRTPSTGAADAITGTADECGHSTRDRAEGGGLARD